MSVKEILHLLGRTGVEHTMLAELVVRIYTCHSVWTML